MFSSLSIRSKIAIVISLLLVGMTGMGILAVYKMSDINAKTVDIQQNLLPSVRALGDMRTASVNYRTVLRGHLLSEAMDAKVAAEQRMKVQDDLSLKTRQTYQPLITSAEERAIFDQWAQEWGAYMKLAEQVVALSRATPPGAFPREANGFNDGKAVPQGQKADALLARLVNLNNTGADKAGADAATDYNAAFLMIASIIAVSAVAGIGIGIYLVRDVSKGIASIVKPMQALGAGDLTAIVPHQGMKTEIGTMGDALQVFKQALIDKRAADQAAAADAEAKIERGRRVDKITSDFETMIGEVVETVSSASTELEASAVTLTATAERAQELTTSVAA
ncbi:MAG: HAMP domain-containing protein, partial [Bradyrhizobiaceae bacterium]